MTNRTVVAIHGISAGGNEADPGFAKDIRKALSEFEEANDKVDLVPVQWADIAQEYLSNEDAKAAVQALIASLGGAGGGIVGGLLGWFAADALADFADMVADVFIYEINDAARKARALLRDAVIKAHADSGKGVILWGNSLGSVIALDVILDMMARNEIGPDVSPERWPVRAFLTTGSPLGLDLPILKGYTDRAMRLDVRFPVPLQRWIWANIYDQHDPVVSGSVFGSAQGLKNLTTIGGYNKLNVVEPLVESGFHVQSHMGYWGHRLVAQTVFELVHI